MQSGFWKADWFLGVLVVALFALFNSMSDLVPSLERKAYDAALAAASRTPSDKIAVIAIDKQSIDNIGRWPWPRDTHARMIDLLVQAKARAIGYLVFFAEPENEKINRTLAKLADASAPAEGQPLGPTLTLLKEAQEEFNTDRKLAASIERAGNVVLPILFVLEAPRGRPDQALAPFIRRNAVSIEAGASPTRSSALAISVLEGYGNAAAALGHLNVVPDVDGAIRSEALVVSHYDEAYPSLSALLVARSLNLAPKDIRVAPGGVRIGDLYARTDADARMQTAFYKYAGERAPFAEDSFFDVVNGKIAAEKYRDKIVLVGPTAAGVANMFVTPVHPAMPAVALQAQVVSSLLQEHFFVVPAWARLAELGTLLAVALYLVVVLPRLSAGSALAVTTAGLAALIAAHFALMMNAGLWLQLMAPAALLVLGHVALASQRFIMTERARLCSDASSDASWSKRSSARARWGWFTSARTRRSAARWRSRRSPSPRSSSPRSSPRSRSAFSARRRPRAGSRTRTSSRSTMRARSTIIAISRWNFCVGTASPALPSPDNCCQRRRPYRSSRVRPTRSATRTAKA